MSAERLRFDTNILFFTIDADAGKRQERAREVGRAPVERDRIRLERTELLTKPWATLGIVGG